MFGRSDGDGERVGMHWTFVRLLTAFFLFLGATLCLVAGLYPFYEGFPEAKDYANIGFVLLLVLFMGSFIKVRKSSRFFFWSLCFALTIYANAIFLYYEDLFF